MNQFDFLISPLTRERFFTEYFEKKHLVVKGASKNKFETILKEEQLDQVLSSQQLTIPKTRMAKKDGDIDANKLTLEGTTIIDMSKVIDHFADGATLIMSGLQDRLPALKNFCDSMTQFFGQPFQTNIYCTPGQKNQGFIVHHDTHDVFILQTKGSKEWKIYESPIELAVKDQEFDKDKHHYGDVIDEFTLEEGDLLYIPRGLMHAAATTDEKSIHVTAGLMGITWQDVLIDKINLLTQENEALRRGFKANYWSDDQASNYTDTYKEIIAILQDEACMEDALKQAYKKSLNRYRPAFVNPILQAEHIQQLSHESLVQLVPSISYFKEIEDDVLTLSLYNKEIELPAAFDPVLDYIIEEKQFSVYELPLLDQESQLEFTETLIKAGFIETVLEKVSVEH